MNKNMKMINKNLKNIPLPSNINLWWNMGSLLGMCLSIQLITGIFLTFHYNSSTLMAFESIIQIMRNVNNGWFIRLIHANGASLFFLIIFMHVGRGLYYGSYKIKYTWMSGNLILLTTMATAFLGYVLPWGQMSFWGATVITNLMSAIPYLGNTIVNWIWGGFAVDSPTLSRFFSFHFILPFLISLLSIIHMTLLHEKGSSNPLGINSSQDKISFHPFFTIKDLMSMILTLIMLLIMLFYSPFTFMDPENFIQANPMMTPPHIQPEWYFLFAYAILRSIPNKLGGVVALMMSIMILLTLPFSMKSKFQSCINYPMNKFILWMLFNLIILLTWVGARPVSQPFILTSQILTIMYFSQFLMLPILTKLWDKMN
uniref:Cytochrome b n=1 Tax=Nisia fuliginosa TaxID=2743077 RepID=A0A8A4JNT3_9HEMI|nr:cytochrome b [Nisia fuliginosa]